MFQLLKESSINDDTKFVPVSLEMINEDILVSYDLPVDETIESIVERAFTDDWFNKEHDLNITKSDLTELLRIVTKNQLFQFEETPTLSFIHGNREPDACLLQTLCR